MPLLIQDLGISTGEFGMVVAAFGCSKLLANIPAAHYVEVYGRKPFLSYSFGLLALGVGGIGFAASTFDLIAGCDGVQSAVRASMQAQCDRFAAEQRTLCGKPACLTSAVAALAPVGHLRRAMAASAAGHLPGPPDPAHIATNDFLSQTSRT